MKYVVFTHSEDQIFGDIIAAQNKDEAAKLVSAVRHQYVECPNEWNCWVFSVKDLKQLLHKLKNKTENEIRADFCDDFEDEIEFIREEMEAMSK